MTCRRCRVLPAPGGVTGKRGSDVPTLLGIDIGTTHVKARAYDEEGRLLGDARRPTPTQRLPGGGAHYHAHSLEEAAFDAAREVVERVGTPWAIGVASMGEAGFLTGDDGEPLGPAIAWFDGRTAPQAARWIERLPSRELYARTGLHVTPLYSACKLEWLREHSPDAWARASGWLGMSEYLIFRMTGRRGTDPSLASRTMLYGIESGEWDEELCALAGVPVELLPPVYPAGTGPGELTPEAAARISTRAGIPVVVSGHDHVCGSLGAGATAPGEVADSMGTAEAALLTLPRPPLDEPGYELGLPVGCHVLPERFYAAAALPVSGGLVRRLLDLLEGDEEDLARWTQGAASLAPGEGGLCLPPTDDAPDEAALVLLSLGHESRPEHALRAVLEGLTLEVSSALRRALRASGVEPTGITLVGGGAQSDLWARLKADASNLPVRVVSDPECVARGAALLAGVGAGVFPDADSVPRPDYETALEPSGDHAEYERLYSGPYDHLRKIRATRRAARDL
jgi:xylulokinase